MTALIGQYNKAVLATETQQKAGRDEGTRPASFLLHPDRLRSPLAASGTVRRSLPAPRGRHRTLECWQPCLPGYLEGVQKAIPTVPQRCESQWLWEPR